MSWIDSEQQESKKIYKLTTWVAYLFLTTFILLLIYTYYQDQAEISQGRLDRYFKYYLISLAGILFWATVLRLREGVRVNIVIMAISLVAGLYLVEGGLFFLGLGQSNNNRTVAAMKLGVDYDRRTKLEVIEDMNTKGLDAVPIVSPRSMLKMSEKLLPLGGVSKKISIGSNETGRYMVYPSDRHGFNNPDSEWDAPKLEWLLTGDSFTEGMAVQRGEDIAGQFRLITHQPVISLGKSGNGPLMELAAISEYAPSLRPNKVLWIYFEGNDLRTDLQQDKKNYILMQYLEDGFSQNLISRQKEVDSLLETYITSTIVDYRAELLHKTRWVRLYRVRNIIGFDNVDMDTDTDTDDTLFDVNINDPLFTKILIKAKEMISSWRGKLYFVYLPEYARYSRLNVSHDLYLKKAEVINVVRELGIPVFDIHKEVFSKNNDPLSLFPLRLSGHYNAKGYTEVAKAIVSNIEKYEQDKLKSR